MSAPVLNEDGGSYYGFIDLMDFVGYFLEELVKKEPSDKVSESWTVFQKQTSFDKVLVKDILGTTFFHFLTFIQFDQTFKAQSHRNLFFPIRNEYSIFNALEIMALEPNVHRIPIVDHRRKVVNLITQSALVKFLADHSNQLGSIKDKPVSEMPEVLHSVFSVTENCLAIDCFKLILKRVTPFSKSFSTSL